MLARRLVMLIAFFAMPLLGDTFKVADINKFWVESGINEEMVKGQISNAVCLSSPQYLESCRAAVTEFKRDSKAQTQFVDDDDFDSVVEAVSRIKNQPRPKEWIMGQMINAHLLTFDPHANLTPTAAWDAMMAPGMDVRSGAGIKIMTTDTGVYVRMVLPKSPAEAAGLKVYDRLAKINGVEVGDGVAGQNNSNLLSGSLGDVVNLVVERDGKMLNLAVKIGPVYEGNVTAQKISYLGKKYSYIRLSEFKEGSCDAVKDKLSSVKAQSLGLILDLRDNPGGIVEQAVCIAGLFVGQKAIVGQKIIDLTFPIEVGFRPKADGTVMWQKAFRSAVLDDFPLVVLINADTASAAELVTGALQDYKAAWVVGERSWGKGSVQTVEPLPNNKRFDIAFTTALFYRPNGNTNQLNGVTPDFSVPFKRTASAADRKFPREGEMFSNSIKPTEGPSAFQELRTGDQSNLQHCVEDSARDLEATEVFTQKIGYEDYQQGYAIGLLDCLTPTSAQHNVARLSKK